jgi:hypothetical protein
MSNLLSQKWLLSRRHFLRGVGATIALPLLDCMRPLRAAAAARGDPDAVHLWAGEGWRAVTEEPAGDLTRRIAREAGLSATA